MTADRRIDRFWDRASDATGLSGPRPVSWAFGDSPGMADELLSLVLDGTKTATTGALWHYEADGEPVPAAGDLSILLDGAGAPRALIRTTEARVVTFAQVDADLARDEGEDDRTLAAWRQGHERYFRRTLPPIGREFSPDMPVVCERFALLYAE